MNIQCRLGFHSYGEWESVGFHLERRCRRCPKTEARYPHPDAVLIQMVGRIVLRYLEHKHMERMNAPPLGVWVYKGKPREF